MSITAIGRAKKDKITYRSGAKVGDVICITGDVGASFLGTSNFRKRETGLFINSGRATRFGRPKIFDWSPS
ncbi:MAG: hypothetical protein R2769_10085 [Saprospiraceae bacterium]